MTLLVVHRVPLYVKHPGKSGNENPNAGFDPHVWPPSDFLYFLCQCLNIHMIWNAFASWYTVRAILIYILCTSVLRP